MGGHVPLSALGIDDDGDQAAHIEAVGAMRAGGAGIDSDEARPRGEGPTLGHGDRAADPGVRARAEADGESFHLRTIKVCGLENAFEWNAIINGVVVQLRTNVAHLNDFWVDNWYPAQLEAAHQLYLKLPSGSRDDAVAMQFLIPGWKFDPKKPCLVR